MTEVIEGRAVDVTPSSVALTVEPAQHAVQTYDQPTRDPLRALGSMVQSDFDREVQVIKDGRARMLQLQASLLRPEIDYGTIPGTPKPTLLQPGAEALAQFHRLIPEHRQRLVTVPPMAEGWPEEIVVHTTTHLHLGSLEGPVVGTAEASCSSYEDRYLYRTAERVCPSCGKPAIIKGNPKYAPRDNGRLRPGYEKGGWKCWAKRGGCGADFIDNDSRIGTPTKEFVENPRALINTITQISAKRGFVAAIRHTLNITDLFTQDVEDGPRGAGTAPDGPEWPEEAPAAAPAAQRAPRGSRKAADDPKAGTGRPTGTGQPTSSGTPSTPPGETDEPDLFDGPGNLPVLEPVMIVGTPGDTTQVDAQGFLRSIAWRKSGEKPFVLLEILNAAGDGYWRVAVDRDNALETFADDSGGFSLAEGEEVRALGGWNTKGTIVLSMMVGKLREMADGAR